ncbi:putative carbohydrate kinase [Planococcus donghaensis MPA1U2]|uniref:ADP-dependent (S)-NAD(P)H-hydrate dehydratase n=1 Tax=Planococcus donghaensis MPA1U2 TaxID=933115 RepID=E7RF16_9BACL|nr:NAD(P)H-hydrate dehydratase [Planococcus donghaensis]EGA90415.1 putative carbohydrate kinase [Planococcus donghaensis MPA1U2]
MDRASETQHIWTDQQVTSTLPVRETNSHKGSYGTALLVAGTKEMPGAALLAGLGAMRSGVGKLVIATEAEAVAMIVPRLPEATFLQDGLKQIAHRQTSVDTYRAVAIGPGTEPDDSTEQAIHNLLESHMPLVLDAGALSSRSYPDRQSPIILTPHLAEFSRITGVDVEEIQKNRAHYATYWSKKLGVTIVLKGPHTVISFPDGETWINPTGNSALAKGGTGDTLTGMILGMLCCHSNWQHAVLNAVYLHGACADDWVKSRSAHTMLAHELSGLLPVVWARFESQ